MSTPASWDTGVEFVTDLDSTTVYEVSFEKGLRLERALVGWFAVHGAMGPRAGETVAEDLK